MRQAELSQVDGRLVRHFLTIALVLMGMIAVPARDSWAQGKATPPAGAAKAKGAAKPAPGAPKPGVGTAKPKANVPATKPLDATLDPVTKLPKDYKVPPDKPDVMIEFEPLVTPEELAELKKFEGRYKTAIRGSTGNLRDDDKNIIRKGIRYRLAQLCEKDNLQNLHVKREDLTIRDLQQAGKLAPAADVRNVRRFILAEIVKQSEALLSKNLYVRIQAATLIGELDLTETDVQRNLKLEAFADGLSVLTKVLADPQQPVAVKIAASRSAVRLLRFGVPSVPIKHEVANTMVAELKDPKTFFWYQLRLVEALSLLDVMLACKIASRLLSIRSGWS